jgi:hypothetical protein
MAQIQIILDCFLALSRFEVPIPNEERELGAEDVLN